jgi:hypothetical protein
VSEYSNGKLDATVFSFSSQQTLLQGTECSTLFCPVSVLPAAIALELAICSLSRPEDSPLSLIDAESLTSQRVPGPGKQIHGGAWKRRRQLRTVQLSSHSASSDDTQKTQ